MIQPRKVSRRQRRWDAAILFSLLLAVGVFGCGGGGGSGGAPGVAPEAMFSAGPDVGSFPLAVTFDAGESTDSDGTISSYDWDFGDQSSGNGVTTQHTYSDAGLFTVTLTVTDNSGLTGTATTQIDVKPRFTISGMVAPADHAAVDGDVNDPNAEYQSNDSFALAQPIPAPVTLGGYVNVPGAGSPGRSRGVGDANDFFQVSLTRGMNLSLYVAANPESADLDLYLYNQNGILVDASVSQGTAFESLSAPVAGTYFVQVNAVETANLSSASNYTLTIGQPLPAKAGFLCRLSDAFVPGEVIVRFTDASASNRIAPLSDRPEEYGLTSKTKTTGRIALLGWEEGADRRRTFEKLGFPQPGDNLIPVGAADPDRLSRLETLWLLKAVKARSDIQDVSLNLIRKPFVVPNDSFYSLQWNYPLINLPQAWDITTGSPDVIVAVVDTGVLLGHPDMAGQLTAGYDFIRDLDTALDGDGIDPDPDDPGDEDVGGSSFHGTHVAGTIAAASNNARGVAGVAWNARIMPLRALGKGGGTLMDIIEAVKYAAGFENASGIVPARPADIVNLSLGGDTASQIEQDLYREAREAGIFVVAAAGNIEAENPHPIYPAAYDEVISVSAVNINQDLAFYSNSGSFIDLAAPGGDLTRDVDGDGYGDGVASTGGDDASGEIEFAYVLFQGTSMAVPHVAGVIALMKAVDPDLTPDAFDALLAHGDLTRDLGDTGWDDSFGWGLIDAHRAVLAAGSTDPIPATLVVKPGSLNFGLALETAELKTENVGQDTLGITQVTDDADWLTVDPAVVDQDTGLGTYRVTVDRAGLAVAAHSARITFISTANTVDVSVVLQVFSASETPDAGFHYILLIEPDAQDTLDQVSVGVDATGIYPFEFSNLAYGDRFLIYAGTDANNDGFICDSAEACGAYVNLDEPIEIEVYEDLQGLNFATDFGVSLPASAAGSRRSTLGPLRRQVVEKVIQ
ncbi:MAG: S8 family serine peptidase [Deltaproteobacteria bacterium]|nr:S8 family serine peptidase [Deltaproteobacteria bacterium]